MADIRFKDLTTTASSTASDDFFAVDGTTNGTRKLSAFSPSFGGNATVTGTLTVNGGSADLGTGHGVKLYVNNAGAWANKELLVTGYDVLDYTQIKVPGNASNTASIKLNQNGLATFSGSILVSGTTASTSTSTGALVVGNGTSGGLGVGGSIVLGANLVSTASDGKFQITGTGNTTGNKEISLQRSDAADSFAIGLTGSAYAGALTGLGNNEAFIYNSSASAFRVFLGTAATNRFDFTSSQFKINPTTASTSTSSGALVVSGGVGVAGAAYVGGNATVFGTAGITINNINGSGNDSILTLTQSGVSNAFIKNTATTGDIAIGDGGGTYLRITKGVGVVSLLNTSASTSTSTGALVVSGGVGVAKELYIGGLIESSDAAGIRVRTASGTAAKLSVIQTGNATWEMQSIASSSDFAITANSTTDAFRVTTAGNATLAGSVKTSAPSGGTAAAWKLGTVATVSPTSPNRTIEVDIGGTIYYIHAKTTNN